MDFQTEPFYTTMKRHDAINLLNAHRDELAAKHGARSLSLFGSVARDQANDVSDVDLLVEFDRPVGLFGLFELQNRLEQLLGCPADVNTPDSLKVFFFTGRGPIGRRGTLLRRRCGSQGLGLGRSHFQIQLPGDR
jgi:predicted nucleotidyltransferase